MLRTGQIDICYKPSPANLAALKADPKIKVDMPLDTRTIFMALRGDRPILKDKRVRQAFTHAVNRQEMLDSFFNGQGTIISGPFAPGSWAYNLDVQPAAFDAQKSIALLQEAGFTRGADGFMQKDGKKLALTLKVPIEKESEAVKRVVLAFKNYLKNIGADIKVEFKEWQAWKEACSLSMTSTSSSPYGF
jgi:peptide/nickel transport system substrate-binding protein